LVDLSGRTNLVHVDSAEHTGKDKDNDKDKDNGKDKDNDKDKDSNTDVDLVDLFEDDSLDPSLRILQPDESYAFAFKLEHYDGILSQGPKYSVGYPEVAWCASMGESSVFAGESTLMRSDPSYQSTSKPHPSHPPVQVDVTGTGTGNNVTARWPGTATAQMWLKTYCLECPAKAVVGDEVSR
jgi:hypothetical protein